MTDRRRLIVGARKLAWRIGAAGWPPSEGMDAALAPGKLHVSTTVCRFGPVEYSCRHNCGLLSDLSNKGVTEQNGRLQKAIMAIQAPTRNSEMLCHFTSL
jgi:hypothetical protein